MERRFFQPQILYLYVHHYLDAVLGDLYKPNILTFIAKQFFFYLELEK